MEWIGKRSEAKRAKLRPLQLRCMDRWKRASTDGIDSSLRNGDGSEKLRYFS